MPCKNIDTELAVYEFEYNHRTPTRLLYTLMMERLYVWRAKSDGITKVVNSLLVR